jgi:hypothetical protein
MKFFHRLDRECVAGKYMPVHLRYGLTEFKNYSWSFSREKALNQTRRPHPIGARVAKQISRTEIGIEGSLPKAHQRRRVICRIVNPKQAREFPCSRMCLTVSMNSASFVGPSFINKAIALFSARTFCLGPDRRNTWNRSMGQVKIYVRPVAMITTATNEVALTPVLIA